MCNRAINVEDLKKMQKKTNCTCKHCTCETPQEVELRYMGGKYTKTTRG